MARPAFLLGDVMHVSRRGGKFDASRNAVAESSCEDEVIHALGPDTYFS